MATKRKSNNFTADQNRAAVILNSILNSNVKFMESLSIRERGINWTQWVY